jgi:hypothetical protein
LTAYDINYSYQVEEFGNTIVNADDPEQAEMFGLEYVRETYPEANSVIIDSVKEV